MKEATSPHPPEEFSGVLGSKYNLLHKALPYIQVVENTVGGYARQRLIKRGSRRKLIDLGCGTGTTTLAVCTGLSNAEIHAVDNAPVMHQQYEEMMKSKEKFLRQHNLRLTLHLADIFDFLEGQEEGSADVIVSALTIHNFFPEARLRLFYQISRVLRPGGRFVNGDVIARDDHELHALDFTRQIRAISAAYDKPSNAEYGLAWIRHCFRDNAPDFLCRQNEVCASADFAGFYKPRFVKRHGTHVVVIMDKRI